MSAIGDHPVLSWKEARTMHSERWRSESGLPPPKRVIVADDTLKADAAYHHACEGTAMLWRGDFQNAKMLLQAIARRVKLMLRHSRRHFICIGRPRRSALACWACC